MNWIFTEFQYPEKSGQYLCAAPLLDGSGHKSMFLNDYNPKTGFSYDERMKAINHRSRIYAWLAIPELPIRRLK